MPNTHRSASHNPPQFQVRIVVVVLRMLLGLKFVERRRWIAGLAG